MRYLFLVLVTLFTTIGFADEPDVNLHKKCLYPTVKIDSAKRLGSGVIIKSVYVEEHKHWLNTVISSAHIITPPSTVFDFETFEFKTIPTPKYKIIFTKYKDWSRIDKTESYDCHVRRTDYAKDICVLNFWSTEEMPTAEINRDEKLFIGNRIMKIGNGLGDETRIDKGEITGFNCKVLPDMIRTSIFCVPGDSGGPVFHKKKVVAVLGAIRYMNTEEGVRVPLCNISYMIPLSAFTDDDLCIEKPKEEPKVEEKKAEEPKVEEKKAA